MPLPLPMCLPLPLPLLMRRLPPRQMTAYLTRSHLRKLGDAFFGCALV